MAYGLKASSCDPLNANFAILKTWNRFQWYSNRIVWAYSFVKKGYVFKLFL